MPCLRTCLHELLGQAPDGAEFVISRYRLRTTNLRTQLRRIMDRAGLKPWPRLYQNLRASRASELSWDHPIKTCAT
jgi:hypothetical protein